MLALAPDEATSERGPALWPDRHPREQQGEHRLEILLRVPGAATPPTLGDGDGQPRALSTEVFGAVRSTCETFAICGAVGQARIGVV
jgi:hypothetical protein